MFKNKIYFYMAVILAAAAGWAGLSTSAASAEAADCPAENFFDVSGENWNGFTVQVQAACSDEFLVVETNDIPNFEFVQKTPAALQEQTYTFKIPLNPAIAAETSDIPLVGPSGITVTGLLIYGPTESPQDGSRDPYLDGLLDYCGGHTHQGGVYHLHARPDCIFQEKDGIPYLVIGYAFDGFPILAPYICEDAACTEVKEVQSSWVDANPEIDLSWERHEYAAGSGDLDRCNGMLFEDGSYAYFATDSFPYFMGCYMGEVEQSNILPGAGTGGPGQGGQPFGLPGGGSRTPDGFGRPGSGQIPFDPPPGRPPGQTQRPPGNNHPPRPNNR